MASNKITESYSQALLELALEKNCLDATYQEILSLEAVLLSQPEVVQFINRYHVSSDNVFFVSLIEEFASRLNLSSDVNHFLRVICENDRLDSLFDIFKDFKLKVKKQKNIKIVEVTSAQALTTEEISEIKGTLTQKLNADVELTCLIDSAIIGGIVIRIGDHIYDNSMLAKLNSIRNSLSKGAHGL